MADARVSALSGCRQNGSPPKSGRTLFPSPIMAQYGSTTVSPQVNTPTPRASKHTQAMLSPGLMDEGTAFFSIKHYNTHVVARLLLSSGDSPWSPHCVTGS